MQLDSRILAFLSTSLVLWGCASNDEAVLAPPAALDDSLVEVTGIGVARIYKGDTLEIFVKEDPTFDGQYPVREQGDIIIPEVGRIAVEGLTIVEAEARVKSQLEKAQLTSATVMVDRIRVGPGPDAPERIVPTTTVFMSGKVNKPGKHIVPHYQDRKPGIYETILICGGVGRFADERKVTVLRSEEGTTRKSRYTVNVEKIKEGVAEDSPIAEGDIIIVREKSFSL